MKSLLLAALLCACMPSQEPEPEPVEAIGYFVVHKHSPDSLRLAGYVFDRATMQERPSGLWMTITPWQDKAWINIAIAPHTFFYRQGGCVFSHSLRDAGFECIPVTLSMEI